MHHPTIFLYIHTFGRFCLYKWFLAPLVCWGRFLTSRKFSWKRYTCVREKLSKLLCIYIIGTQKQILCTSIQKKVSRLWLDMYIPVSSGLCSSSKYNGVICIYFHYSIPFWLFSLSLSIRCKTKGLEQQEKLNIHFGEFKYLIA